VQDEIELWREQLDQNLLAWRLKRRITNLELEAKRPLLEKTKEALGSLRRGIGRNDRGVAVTENMSDVARLKLEGRIGELTIELLELEALIQTAEAELALLPPEPPTHEEGNGDDAVSRGRGPSASDVPGGSGP
jgi:vacuolar-type H+-ATPase subunit E/Vma4